MIRVNFHEFMEIMVWDGDRTLQITCTERKRNESVYLFLTTCEYSVTNVHSSNKTADFLPRGLPPSPIYINSKVQINHIYIYIYIYIYG